MADLELRHLRAVCAIVETGSMSKAAVRLGLTQPALTAQLQRVERLVGGRLFDRSPTGSTPTELGRYVVNTARLVLDDLDHLLASAQDRARTFTPQPLLAGCMPMLFLARLVAELSNRLPCSEVRTEIEPVGHTLVEMLNSARLHLAVFERFDGLERRRLSGVEIRTLVLEPQFVAVAEDHPLAVREVISLAELADCDWVVPPPEANSLRMQLHTACATAGFTPRIRHHTWEAGMARVLVENGAVSLAAPASRSGNGIAVRPLLGDPLQVPIMVGVRTDGALAGRAHEVFASAAYAYRSIVDRNPTFARWWADHPEAHAELDAAMLVCPPLAV
ncbi:LysR family transcriptional regulator [Crossiella cryophila]|uniref:DNA-binding transcriptional LysR family regulator n=1 Tax=Crossiella cryophila TaxID=43355 RepID=A0A7W7CB03_9PSEU|nr:LysR family transcriptional regulator [Crossiella cryophila]MBB4677819.1 DNA-binding transcriptional LysR family regulator [Crossiella cryophila]